MHNTVIYKYKRRRNKLLNFENIYENENKQFQIFFNLQIKKTKTKVSHALNKCYTMLFNKKNKKIVKLNENWKILKLNLFQL